MVGTEQSKNGNYEISNLFAVIAVIFAYKPRTSLMYTSSSQKVIN